MHYTHFLIEKSDGIATITFNRMEKYNAATTLTLQEIVRIMQDIERDDDIRVAILKSTGQKVFCAGIDLDGLNTQGVCASYNWIDECMACFRAVQQMQKPVIAAVNGLALGFGAEIAFLCDITIAADNASFGFPEVKHGMLPAILVTRGLEMVSAKSVAYLAMTGETISAQEARSIGMISKVVAADDLMAEVVAVANRIKQNAPLGLRTIKRLLNKHQDRDFREVTNFLAPLFLSEDVAEARAAFSQKRKPRFKGN